MNTSQAIIGAGGAGLLLTNLWSSDARTAITAGAFDSSASGADQAAAHTYVKRYAGAALGLGALTLLAGYNSSAGAAGVAVILALWIVWLIMHFDKTAR